MPSKDPEKRREAGRRHYAKHPEKVKRAVREYKFLYPERVREGRLQNKYSLSLEEYNRMFRAQNGLCDICKKAKIKDTDHCHDSLRVRGLLCHPCNVLVNQRHTRDPSLFDKAKEYVVINNCDFPSLTSALKNHKVSDMDPTKAGSYC